MPDPEQCTSEIRPRARRERVRTRVDEHGAVGAMLDAVMKLLKAGHVLATWLRPGDASITFCTRCDARVDIRAAPRVIRDGEAFVATYRPA